MGWDEDEVVGDGLKNEHNEIQSKTVRERITSFASVEYVIVVKNTDSLQQQNTIVPQRAECDTGN